MKFSSRISLLTVLLLFIVLAGCYPWHGSSLSDVKDAEKDVQKALKAGKLDTKSINNAIETYQFFLAYFPYDTVCPAFVYREGELYKMNGDYKKAITTLNNVKGLYPESQKVPDALFLIASINEQNLNNQDSADSVYASILYNYPNSKAAQQAHAVLDKRGITSEDLYKKYIAGFAKPESAAKTDSTKKAVRYRAYWKH